VVLKSVLAKAIARCREKFILQDAIRSRSCKSGSEKAVRKFSFDAA